MDGRVRSSVGGLCRVLIPRCLSPGRYAVTTVDPNAQVQLDFAPSQARAGFRLQRIEVYNWGTFHGRIWGLDLNGNNGLVTGDIGSGKSTLIDAVTTLLVQRVSYNKAAGAEARERSARSYVLGYHKSERGDGGTSARPVAVRGRLFKEAEGHAARLYVVADRPMSIAGDFAGFGSDIGDLRKRLRGSPKVELHDSFPPYAAAFRRRFGIENEQALVLFLQNVSMKSVG
ncbi:MAG: hypothetical protein F8N15_00685, partial [Methanobacterium sp.]|nr:hypothetical protein [Methanobacterium sp.]